MRRKMCQIRILRHAYHVVQPLQQIERQFDPVEVAPKV